MANTALPNTPELRSFLLEVSTKLATAEPGHMIRVGNKSYVVDLTPKACLKIVKIKGKNGTLTALEQSLDSKSGWAQKKAQGKWVTQFRFNNEWLGVAVDDKVIVYQK